MQKRPIYVQKRPVCLTIGGPLGQIFGRPDLVLGRVCQFGPYSCLWGTWLGQKYMWHDSWVCVTWLSCVCDMTWLRVSVSAALTPFWCDVGHDVWACEMTHEYVWHSLLILWYVYLVMCLVWLHVSRLGLAAFAPNLCDMTRLSVCVMGYKYVWPIMSMCDMSHHDSQILMNHVTNTDVTNTHVTNTDESCHKYSWIMSQILMNYVTNTDVTNTDVTNTDVTNTDETCHKYWWIMSQIPMNHVTNTHESCHKYWWIVSQILMSQILMSQILMKHVTNTDATHTDESCHRYDSSVCVAWFISICDMNWVRVSTWAVFAPVLDMTWAFWNDSRIIQQHSALYSATVPIKKRILGRLCWIWLGCFTVFCSVFLFFETIHEPVPIKKSSRLCWI